MLLKNRTEAGARLAEKLRKHHQRNSHTIVLAIPNGGVIIGQVIAQALGWPLELFISEEIGHPYNKEYKIGTICLQSRMLKRRVYVSRGYIEQETNRLRDLLLAQYLRIMGKETPASLQHKELVIVVDSSENMSALQRTVELVKLCKPASIRIAVPVIQAAQLYSLGLQVDEVICLNAPTEVQATGLYFESFAQVSEKDLIQRLHS